MSMVLAFRVGVIALICGLKMCIKHTAGNTMAGAEIPFDVRRAPILDRIVGGKVASVNQLPYMVAIIRNGYHDCGGSIVNELYVLTAGHCVHQQDKYIIRVGTDIWKQKGYDYNVTEFKVHPNHTEEDLKAYDIALIKVKPPFKFNAEVGPVRLAEPSATPLPGTNVLVSGWGAVSVEPLEMPDELHSVKLFVIPNEECEKYYPEEIKPYMLCAGLVDGSGDACFGDSGGPLVDAQGAQVGVVSWGPEGMCACPEQPYGVYTDVAALRDWIDQEMDD